jgi:phosphatidylserine/phosphatidylglycerophosphate/cardiolipin synthase-like enzyme
MPPARPLSAPTPIDVRTEYLVDAEIYRRVILEEVPKAKKLLWIGTSDLKDLYVPRGRGAVPFLAVLAELLERGVAIRLIHAKEPGPNFRRDFDRYAILRRGLERMLCPRVHFKLVAVDQRFAYSGSANLTGAGLGAKSDARRNFESGIVTTDPLLVRRIMRQFDEVWMGKHCQRCGRTEFCSDRVE